MARACGVGGNPDKNFVGDRVTAVILHDENDAREPAGPFVLKLTLVLGVHVAALLWLADMSPASIPEVKPAPMDVRIIETPPAVKPAPVEPPKPLPQTPKPPVQPKRPAVRPAPAPKPAPVLAARPDNAPAASTFTVPPQPAPAPRQEAPAVQPSAPPAAAPVATPARFDADYLQNPAPAYPSVSKRMREEGTVQLLVRVSAGGTAERVEVKQTSGSPRLDEAAVKTVQQWRFVAARVGNETVAATVVVPIVFRLDS